MIVVIHTVHLDDERVEVEVLAVLNLLLCSVHLDLAMKPRLGDAPIEVGLQ